MIRKTLILTGAVLAAILLPGCGSGNRKAEEPAGKELITRARNLSIREAEGYTLVRIRNAWDTTRTLASYVLVNRNAPLPDGIDTVNNTLLRIPLQNALVYSNPHVSLIRELGGLEGIRGICDSGYITDSLAKSRIASGIIADCGLSNSPNVERIMSMRPDGIILSPMSQGDKHEKLTGMNVPLIEAADYLENDPLARAEWMKFYGRLFNKGKEADLLFNSVCREYESIKQMAGNLNNKPVILFDGIYNNVWNVPTANSVTGTLIRDAGGVNPFDKLTEPGSAPISAEKVLFQAGNADIWFVRYFKPHELTLGEWETENNKYTLLKPFKEGNVYGCNTSWSPLFDDIAFHPQWVLSDMVRIMHPEANAIPQYKKYFHKLNR